MLFGCDTKKMSQPTPETEMNEFVFETKPQNIILLIGDGMGIGQITAGTYLNGNKTALSRFTHMGLHKPYSTTSLITDSAAAATSFASGVKTFNGAIGVDMDSMPVPTFLEEAEQKGMVTGLVASSTIVHATPAAFIAHNASRRNYEEIAEDFLKTEIEYFVGGGKKFFDRRDKDERNLIKELEAKGYTMGTYLEEFKDFYKANTSAKKMGFLTADKDPLPVSQGRDYLIPAASNGIRFLSQRSMDNNGFFLMVEGSQIDWGGHANDENYIVTEFIEFDKIIEETLDWAEKDGNTLVIVTADHETGGFTLQPGSQMDSLVTTFTSTKHSGDFIPVFAKGPKAELFSGIYENTAIYDKMREAMGW